MDETQIKLAVRKAILPILKDELVTEIAKTVGEELRKALVDIPLTVEIDSQKLDKHLADFLAKRDAPKIIVQPAEVRVESNWDPIIKVLEGIDRAEILRKAEEAGKTYASPDAISDYRPHDQDSAGKIYKYFGFVAPSGGWYIMRQAKQEQRYTAGIGNYEDAWEKREKQSFGLIEGKIGG